MFFKWLLYMILILILMNFMIQFFAPQFFENNKLRKCSSSIHMRGLCANQDLKKGTSIGLLASIQSETEFEDTEFGGLLNHSDNNNIELYPLEYGSRLDIYGYTKKDIDEGEELFANYKDEFAPKPNFLSKDVGAKIKKFFQSHRETIE